jgi:drug/metabolite transporter (DMT)-like permease
VTSASDRFSGYCGGRLPGVLWIVASATGFGTMAIFAKTAYGDGVGLEALLFLRFALAGGLMAAFLCLSGRPWPVRPLWPGLLVMGGVGYVGQSYCYFAALHHASAGLTALLLYLYPVLVTLLAAVLGRQALNRRKVLAVAIACCGTLLTIGGQLTGSPLGIGLGLGAALIYSCYILAGERLTAQAGPLAASTVIMLAAAVVYGVLAIWRDSPWPASAAGWGAVFGIVLLSTILGMVGFFAGMARLGAADAATLSTLEPVVTVLLAALFLGESVGLWQVAGGALILSAVLLLAREGAPPQGRGDSA